MAPKVLLVKELIEKLKEMPQDAKVTRAPRDFLHDVYCDVYGVHKHLPYGRTDQNVNEIVID